MTVLRKFIKQCITEAATSAQQASGMALYVATDGPDIQLIMYDPKAILDRAMLAIKDDTFDESMFMDGMELAVRGLVIIREPSDPCNGAYEVANSVASKGFGPLMYDIAMSVAPNNTIMSDRNKVSGAATNVWKHYYDNRGDVEKKQLDNVEDPQTKDPNDDCQVHGDDKRPFLNFSYTSSGVNPHPMINNHMKFVRDIQTALKSQDNWQPSSVINMIEIFASAMFQDRYAKETAHDPFPS